MVITPLILLRIHSAFITTRKNRFRWWVVVCVIFSLILYLRYLLITFCFGQDQRLPSSEVYESPIVRKVNLNHLYSDTPILEPSATSSRKGNFIDIYHYCDYHVIENWLVNVISGSAPRNDAKMLKKRIDSSSDIEGSGDSIRPDHLSLHSRFGESKKYDIMGK